MATSCNSNQNDTKKDFSTLLLEQLKSPNFFPTLALEKRLAEKFCVTLNQICDIPSDSSLALLEDYVNCILAVAEKDEKFFSLYFGAMDKKFYEQMINLLSNDLFISNCWLSLHTKFLVILKCITFHIPSKKTVLITSGLHMALLSHPFDIDLLALKMETLDMLCDSPLVLGDLASINYLSFLFDVLRYLACSTNDGDTPKVNDAVLKTLNVISKVVENRSLPNIKHLKKFDHVFSTLVNTFPTLEKTICVVHQQVHEVVASSSTRCTSSIGTSPSSSSVQPLKTKLKNFQFNISFRDLKPFPNSKQMHMTREPLDIERHFLSRFVFVDNVDSQRNAFLSCKSIDQVSLETTSELICGMLNSNYGGIIHLGLTASGQVDGILLNHAQRDGLRCGVDNLFLTEIAPLISSDLVSVIFTPVKSENSRNHKESLYVVQIIIPANMNTLYYLKNRSSCYVRILKENKKLTLKEVRHLAVSLSERRYSA